MCLYDHNRSILPFWVVNHAASSPKLSRDLNFKSDSIAVYTMAHVEKKDLDNDTFPYKRLFCATPPKELLGNIHEVGDLLKVVYVVGDNDEDGDEEKINIKVNHKKMPKWAVKKPKAAAAKKPKKSKKVHSLVL